MASHLQSVEVQVKGHAGAVMRTVSGDLADRLAKELLLMTTYHYTLQGGRHLSASLALPGATAALALVLLVPKVAPAYDIPVKFGGKEQIIRSSPHRPVIVINSLAELRQRYDEVKSVIPCHPFRMDGQWVVRCRGAIRCVPQAPGRSVVFSRNGEFMVSYALGQVDIPDRAFDVELAATDGRLLWRHDEGPARPVVGNTGIVAGHLGPDGTPANVVIYDRGGHEAARLHDFMVPFKGPRLVHVYVFDEVGVVLILSITEVDAFSLDGSPLWRRQYPELDAPRRVSDVGVDPLGRGLYLTSVVRTNARDIEIVDPLSGATRQWLWRARPNVRNPRYFSADGHMAVLVGERERGLIDWGTGATIFARPWHEAAGPPGSASPAASGNPPRLVMWSKTGETEVYDAAGHRVWRCRTSLRLMDQVISNDGKRLGLAAFDDWQSMSVVGLLVYDLNR